MDIRLLIIDPQNDFCDPNGSLFVPGADQDMERLSTMLDRTKDKLSDIHITLDSHRYVDVAHPIFWVDSEGKNPDPFTLISVDGVKNGVWKPKNPQFQSRMMDYVKSLDNNNRYMLCVWPPHCLIGSWGYSIHSKLYESLIEWEKGFAIVDYVTKGSNIFTEHYSAVQADVPDAEDPGTMLNTGLIETLEAADMIALAGEASSHCLANTVRDIANNFGEASIKKMTLLTDATSPVTGFEKMAEDFLTEMTQRGMNLSTTEEFLK